MEFPDFVEENIIPRERNLLGEGERAKDRKALKPGGNGVPF
jgi:hypothetical protein